MSILLIPGKFDAKLWTKAIKDQDSSIVVEVWPNVQDFEAVEVAVVWRYPHGELKKYPNLRAILSFGAGVDHIISDPDLPELPIARVVDPYLIRDMTQYVTLMCLYYLRQLDYYLQAKAVASWTPRVFDPDLNIGIMGLGQLGSAAAEMLTRLGLKVSGWSRSAKQIEAVVTFAGDSGLAQFLAQTDILVCLLPLTEQTRGLINYQLLAKLKPGSYLINVARGAHVVEQDLLKALDDNILSGACLDVFDTEPLPKDHVFWRHPKITLTPHIASVTNPELVAEQFVVNYHRAVQGKPLLHQINRDWGY